MHFPSAILEVAVLRLFRVLFVVTSCSRRCLGSEGRPNGRNGLGPGRIVWTVERRGLLILFVWLESDSVLFFGIFLRPGFAFGQAVGIDKRNAFLWFRMQGWASSTVSPYQLRLVFVFFLSFSIIVAVRESVYLGGNWRDLFWFLTLSWRNKFSYSPHFFSCFLKLAYSVLPVHWHSVGVVCTVWSCYIGRSISETAALSKL